MKRWMALAAACTMFFSLTACGSGGNGGSQTYELGDTITSENWEMTVTDVAFGTNLNTDVESDDYLLVDGDYNPEIELLDGSTANKAYVAEEGRAYAVVAYELTYTGKESAMYDQQMAVAYGDGYLYDVPPYANSIFEIRVDGRFQGETFWNFEPLAESVEIRACYDIPLEVMEDTETPLSVIVTLDGTEYTYTVR